MLVCCLWPSHTQDQTCNFWICLCRVIWKTYQPNSVSILNGAENAIYISVFSPTHSNWSSSSSSNSLINLYWNHYGTPKEFLLMICILDYRCYVLHHNIYMCNDSDPGHCSSFHPHKSLHQIPVCISGRDFVLYMTFPLSLSGFAAFPFFITDYFCGVLF